jgi:hypothetical protein
LLLSSIFVMNTSRALLLGILAILGAYWWMTRMETHDPIDVLEITRIESASLRGPGIDGQQDLAATQARALLRSLCPHEVSEEAEFGWPVYYIDIFAAGNHASIAITLSENHIVFRLDGIQYAGGDPKQFSDLFTDMIRTTISGQESDCTEPTDDQGQNVEAVEL